MLPWFIGPPSATRRIFAAAAGVYLFGALGLEAASGWYFDGDETRRDVVYDLLTTVEESCEMAGLLLFSWWGTRHVAEATGARGFYVES